MENSSGGVFSFLKGTWQLISSASHSRTFSLLVLLVIMAAVPLTVFVAQKQQETRQRAQTPGTCTPPCSAGQVCLSGACVPINNGDITIPVLGATTTANGIIFNAKIIDRSTDTGDRIVALFVDNTQKQTWPYPFSAIPTNKEISGESDPIPLTAGLHNWYVEVKIGATLKAHIDGMPINVSGPAPATVTISGRAIDGTTSSAQGMSGIKINETDNCGVGSATTGSDGRFTIPNVPTGTFFCLRASTIEGHTGPDKSYECQIAGRLANPSDPACSRENNRDLAEDNNFIFTYSSSQNAGNITFGGPSPASNATVSNPVIFYTGIDDKNQSTADRRVELELKKLEPTGTIIPLESIRTYNRSNLFYNVYPYSYTHNGTLADGSYSWRLKLTLGTGSPIYSLWTQFRIELSQSITGNVTFSDFLPEIDSTKTNPVSFKVKIVDSLSITGQRKVTISRINGLSGKIPLQTYTYDKTVAGNTVNNEYTFSKTDFPSGLNYWDVTVELVNRGKSYGSQMLSFRIGSTSIIRSKGDINGDGAINLIDYNAWRDRFGGSGDTGCPSEHTDGKICPDIIEPAGIDILDFNAWYRAYSSMSNR